MTNDLATDGAGLGRFVVPLVEKRIERFQDQCLVRFFS
jgi:hypothetical protein